MAVRQTRQHAAQLIQYEKRKYDLQRAVPPGSQNLAGHAGGIGDAGKQYIGVEHHPQRGHFNSTRLGVSASFGLDCGLDLRYAFSLRQRGVASFDASA